METPPRSVLRVDPTSPSTASGARSPGPASSSTVSDWGARTGSRSCCPTAPRWRPRFSASPTPRRRRRSIPGTAPTSSSFISRTSRRKPSWSRTGWTRPSVRSRSDWALHWWSSTRILKGRLEPSTSRPISAAPRLDLAKQDRMMSAWCCTLLVRLLGPRSCRCASAI